MQSKILLYLVPHLDMERVHYETISNAAEPVCWLLLILAI